MGKRLGVYEWKNVFEVAKEDLAKSVMAIRFSHTRLLRRRVRFDELSDIYMKRLGRLPVVRGPSTVPEAVLAAILDREEGRIGGGPDIDQA